MRQMDDFSCKFIYPKMNWAGIQGLGPKLSLFFYLSHVVKHHNFQNKETVKFQESLITKSQKAQG